MTTVHDLAADWGWMETHQGFRVNGLGVLWEEAEYFGDRVRIARVTHSKRGALYPVLRWPDPMTPVTLVAK